MIAGVDTNGPTWRAINKHINKRFSSLQAQLEGDADPIVTAKIRGRIKELRELVADAAEAPVEEIAGPPVKRY